jgi:cell division protein FtsB
VHRRINLWIVVALAALMIVAFIVVNARIGSEKAKIDNEIKIVNMQNIDLTNANSDLTKQVEEAKTDAFIEQYARDTFGYMTDGELRFVISFPDENVGENDPSL